MSERIKIVILSGDKKITRMMQSLDVFEQSKVIAKEWAMTFAKKQNFDVKKCVDGIRAALESEMNQNIAAMFVVGHEDAAYVNEKVQSVSDGKNWFLLRDWLKTYGIQASV
jgi:hypothetical protein